MTRPGYRTRSRKRVCKSLPGGNSGTHYMKKIAVPSHCILCGQPLAGVLCMSVQGARKVNRGKRRVWRVHGGQLCHNCVKTSLRQTARTL